MVRGGVTARKWVHKNMVDKLVDKNVVTDNTAIGQRLSLSDSIFILDNQYHH